MEKLNTCSKSSGFSNVILLSFLVILIALAGGVFLFLRRSNAPTPIVQKSPEEKQVEWKTYTDTKAGFSLQYPSTVLLSTGFEAESKLTLNISAEELSTIPEDLPLFMGRVDAMKEKERLEKGEGDGVVKIGALNGQVETTLGQFEVCNVFFSRKLTFYPNGYRIIITLMGPKDLVIASMPEFFKVDNANCGDSLIWDENKRLVFEETLGKSLGKGIAQEWFDTFNKIVETVTYTKLMPKVVEPTPIISDLLVYKNDKYGFEISYPKPYKALTDSDNLSGWKNSVVILYSGGQAYDVVIQVWDSKAQLEQEFSSNMKDVTVVKVKDKYITLLNGTQSEENKKIISSFKAL